MEVPIVEEEEEEVAAVDEVAPAPPKGLGLVLSLVLLSLLL